MLKIGVLAVQGAFLEHMDHLKKLKGVVAVEVRTAEELSEVDGLILPGGESTAMIRIMQNTALENALKLRIQSGLPTWGTCAGLILLAREVDGKPGFLGAMDIAVKRNAYGSQQDSFVALKTIPLIHKVERRCIFIRAPLIATCGLEVEVLATHNSKVIAARQGQLMVTTYHPELTNHNDYHQFFVDGIRR